MKGSIIYGLDEHTIAIDDPNETRTIDIMGYDHGFIGCSDGTTLEFRYHGVFDIMLHEAGRDYEYTDYWTVESDRSDCVHFKNKIKAVSVQPIID